ncbi:hypothetical protein HY478_00030 [Candidatus Uhrbacteria bacterium]|nr:hypothetical protein [Candidatus Uhrbacteria bacterium]
MPQHRGKRIGLDVGRVILNGSDADLLRDFDHGRPRDRFAAIHAVPRSFHSIRRLVEEIFGTEVWLVSRCGEQVELKVRAWLEYRRFFDETGIDPGHLKFCRQDEEKARIAAHLRLTHFVDDRMSVLGPMRGIVPHRILFRPEEQDRRQADHGSDPSLAIARTWREVMPLITATNQTTRRRRSR